MTTEEHTAMCGVCQREVVAFVGPPSLGELSFRVVLTEASTYLPMCLDCAAELIKWLTHRREVARG